MMEYTICIGRYLLRYLHATNFNPDGNIDIIGYDNVVSGIAVLFGDRNGYFKLKTVFVNKILRRYRSQVFQCRRFQQR